MQSISTRTGDTGETSLYTGERVPKDHPCMTVLGDIDEMNAVLAIVRADGDCHPLMKHELFTLQNLLFRLGGDIATPLAVQSKQNRMNETDVALLDAWGHSVESKIPTQHAFLVPGGNMISAHLHLARTICRRIERNMVTLGRSERVNPYALQFINRLSDVLFLFARKSVIDRGVKEEEVQY